MAEECPFCPEQAEYWLEEELAGVVWDGFPVNPGHALIVPKAHRRTLFDCTPEETRDMWALLQRVKEHIDRRHEPDGYNIGVNVEATAGQTVFHCHVHVIPRYRGDTRDPRGGVRRVKRPQTNY